MKIYHSDEGYSVLISYTWTFYKLLTERDYEVVVFLSTGRWKWQTRMWRKSCEIA